VSEERRLLYVGITRAKRHLAITWVNDGRRKGSVFLGELRAEAPRSVPREQPSRPSVVARVGLEVRVSGGYTGSIVEIEADRAVVEVEGGSLLTVPFGEPVVTGGSKLLLEAPEEGAPPLLGALKEWRRERARSDGVPAFVVFHDSTLEEIGRAHPRSLSELAAIGGVGPTKLERYGADLLAILGES
jgi:DNA helicase II / ATP-dependent DNA helicase PcrA